jgi:syringate O-demethylase
MVVSRGKTIGLSAYSVYTSNGRSWISLGLLDEAYAIPGTEVTVVWGERDGGSAKPVVERHVQTEIRAVVAPSPYSEVARESYRPRVLQR